MLGLAVALGARCGEQPLEPTPPAAAGGTGAGGVTGAGGIMGAGGATDTDRSSEVGVVGDWFTFGDGVGPSSGVDAGADSADSDCVKKGGFPAAACTRILSPTPGQPFAPSNGATSQYCTTGVAALVMDKDGSPDYSDLWGGGIGLDFDGPAGDAGAAGYANLSGYTGIAFDFSGDVVPPMSMRVSFPFLGEHGTDSPYWDGTMMPYSPLTGTTADPQHVEIRWADVGGPQYLLAETPPVAPTPFDPTAVQAIEFLVFTNTAATTPYSFCVANLAFLTD
jgi:hypothetical protein